MRVDVTAALEILVGAPVALLMLWTVVSDDGEVEDDPALDCGMFHGTGGPVLKPPHVPRSKGGPKQGA